MAARKLTKKDLEQFDQLLRQMLSVIRGDIDALESSSLGPSAAPSDLSAEDSGAVIHSLEVSLELLGRDEKAAGEILDALARIQAGTFGICAACEKQIPKARLRAMPHARNCIACQRACEQGQE